MTKVVLTVQIGNKQEIQEAMSLLVAMENMEGTALNEDPVIEAAPEPSAAPEAPSTPEPPAIDPPEVLDASSMGSPMDLSLGLDTAGNPWVKGIHTEAKTTNKDGTWKFARGIDREAAVEELKSYKLEAEEATSSEPLAPAPTAPEPPAVPEAPAAPTAPEPPAVPEAPAAPTAPEPPAAPTADTEAPIVDFPGLMIKVVAATKTGKIDHAQIDELAKSLGHGGLVHMNKKPAEDIQALVALIDSHIAAAPQA